MEKWWLFDAITDFSDKTELNENSSHNFVDRLTAVRKSLSYHALPSSNNRETDALFNDKGPDTTNSNEWNYDC